ncbi:PHA/PHB synthase family protein [Pseudomonas fluorescens]|uniref:PHA/PHB synthase family protein n=1 Tax=Pseudomonas fluorescens TaxID=294 RepID=UPI001241BCA0|nr:alpha/beta fold hydrolase [Pseudomonas fluorescens]VVM95599.1 Poly(3-hydroxyalkanoate) polymerase subunit PhaC [Pseudomonas fluorescens]
MTNKNNPKESKLARLARLTSNGGRLASVSARMMLDLAAVGLGRSQVEADKGDRRFNHPAWENNPAYRRLGQAYLVWSRSVNGLADQLDTPDWRKREQLRFTLNVLTSAAAPTNSLLGNPAALQKAFDSGGSSMVRGAKNRLSDLRHNRGMPSQVDTEGFKVGENLAVTPGSVVYRNEVFELIEYRPSTAKVRERPLLLVPPMIGKYYFLDLAPGRSFIEYAVGSGLHFFTISWRNPRGQHTAWGLNTYTKAVIEALEVVQEISGSADVNAHGFCAGGLVLSCALNHLATQGKSPVHAASFGVILLDFDTPGPIGAFSPKPVLDLARRRAAKTGIMNANDMSAAFTWLRPNDLVWNYWHNNYLLGEAPPAIDIMAWNADGTRLPAALHSQFLDIFSKNALIEGELCVLGSPLQAGSIQCDSYFMAAEADHLTPWQGCYRSAQLFGGERSFVLSNAGHIASLVNPPTNLKARYFTGPAPDIDADDWLAQASEQTGTWWTHWSQWVIDRAGAERNAPKTAGSKRFPVLEAAPGRYIHE